MTVLKAEMIDLQTPRFVPLRGTNLQMDDY
jgi:hypothetical protein